MKITANGRHWQQHSADRQICRGSEEPRERHRIDRAIRGRIRSTSSRNSSSSPGRRAASEAAASASSVTASGERRMALTVWGGDSESELWRTVQGTPTLPAVAARARPPTKGASSASRRLLRLWIALARCSTGSPRWMSRSPAAPFLRLPATGETTCWDRSGDGIACAGTGQDGDVLTGAAPRYTCSADGTITDNNTGLAWEETLRQAQRARGGPISALTKLSPASLMTREQKSISTPQLSPLEKVLHGWYRTTPRVGRWVAPVKAA